MRLMTTSDKIVTLSQHERTPKIALWITERLSRVLGTSIIPSFCHASVRDKAPFPCD
jgi:hypothetical protein